MDLRFTAALRSASHSARPNVAADWPAAAMHGRIDHATTRTACATAFTRLQGNCPDWAGPHLGTRDLEPRRWSALVGQSAAAHALALAVHAPHLDAIGLSGPELHETRAREEAQAMDLGWNKR